MKINDLLIGVKFMKNVHIEKKYNVLLYYLVYCDKYDSRYLHKKKMGVEKKSKSLLHRKKV